MAELSSTIKEVQRALGLEADGIAGSLTWAAISKAILGDKPPTADTKIDTTLFDERTERNIKTLLPVVQPLAREFITLCSQAGIDARIISGKRTYEEQDALYSKGRTSEGPIVTNARGGYSNHNFGLAWDIGVFENGRYLEESPRYAQAGSIGAAMGLIWGGFWVGFPDEAHFEFRPDYAANMTESEALAEYRARVKSGAPIA